MDASPLAKLPRELRDQTYSLVLNELRYVSVGTKDHTRSVVSPITRTCRQLRLETRLLDFEHLGVRSHGPKSDRRLGKWLILIGVAASSNLRHIGEFFHPRDFEPDIQVALKLWETHRRDEVLVTDTFTLRAITVEDRVRHSYEFDGLGYLREVMVGMGFELRHWEGYFPELDHTADMTTFKLGCGAIDGRAETGERR